jgi:hypothetical protein
VIFARQSLIAGFAALICSATCAMGQESGSVTNMTENWYSIMAPGKGASGPTVTLSTDATNDVVTQTGFASAPTLNLRCEAGQAQVYLFIGGVTLSDEGEFGSVGYTLTGERPQIARMKTNGVDGYIGLWSGPDAAILMESIARASDIGFSVAIPNEERAQFRFDLAGLDEVIGPLAEECPW